MMNKPVRLQLVDDHDVVRIGFRHLLEEKGDMQVVVESATGKQACRDYAACQADLVIMDISMPDISGLETMRRILHGYPEARILMLSMHAGMVAERAMQMGAKGFVCKRSGARVLLTAIHKIMQGGRFLDAEAGVVVLPQQMQVNRPLPSSLTRREKEICILLSEGRRVADIALSLHLSGKTVYTHRQHIMDKLGVNSTVELVQVASRMGVLG